MRTYSEFVYLVWSLICKVSWKDEWKLDELKATEAVELQSVLSYVDSSSDQKQSSETVLENEIVKV